MTDLSPNHLIIQIAGVESDDRDLMITDEASSFGAVDGEWTLRLLVSACVEFLHLGCMSMTGGARLSDVPAESRLKAIEDSLAQTQRLLTEAASVLRADTINPDDSGLTIDTIEDEAIIEDRELPRLATPEDLQP